MYQDGGPGSRVCVRTGNLVAYCAPAFKIHSAKEQGCPASGLPVTLTINSFYLIVRGVHILEQTTSPRVWFEDPQPHSEILRDLAVHLLNSSQVQGFLRLLGYRRLSSGKTDRRLG